MVMRGPRTFTGEDTVEINCHGGTYVVDVYKRQSNNCLIVRFCFNNNIIVWKFTDNF